LKWERVDHHWLGGGSLPTENQVLTMIGCSLVKAQQLSGGKAASNCGNLGGEEKGLIAMKRFLPRKDGSSKERNLKRQKEYVKIAYSFYQTQKICGGCPNDCHCCVGGPPSVWKNLRSGVGGKNSRINYGPGGGGRGG